MNYKFCTKCGEKNIYTATYCQKCGNKIDDESVNHLKEYEKIILLKDAGIQKKLYKIGKGFFMGYCENRNFICGLDEIAKSYGELVAHGKIGFTLDSHSFISDFSQVYMQGLLDYSVDEERELIMYRLSDPMKEYFLLSYNGFGLDNEDVWNATEEWRKLSNNRWGLLSAVEKNDISSLIELILSGVNIDFQDTNGNTPLMIALHNKKIDIAKELIKLNADIYKKNQQGSTALSIALGKAYNSEESDEYFAICIKLINICDDNTWHEYFEKAEYSLIEASKSNNIGVVKKLIKAGMFLNFRDRNSLDKTALLHSIIEGNLEIAKLLITAGAETDLQTPSPFNFCAIGWAAMNGYDEIIDLLIREGADLNLIMKTGPNRLTPLLEALTNEHYTSAIKLIEAGANINAYAYSDKDFDENGNFAKKYTPLIVASAEGEINVIKKLIEYGANINFQDSDGDTALMVAIMNQNEKIANELIKAGANMTLQNKEGKTALDLSLEITDDEN